MSVTFAAEDTSATDARVFAVTCSKGGKIGEFVGYGNAYAEGQAHGLLCDDDLCQGYGADVDEIHADGEPIPVNVNNRNAIDLLRVLGYPVALEDPELYGEADAADFLARVTLAAAMEPDGTLTEVVTVGGEILPGLVAAGTVIECGRPADYLVGRLAQLRALAEACARTGARVVWG